ncbi:hypothetical protein PR048_019973 [Dryococelus australis]|uniref:Uncharacterized protein n=1 Tax=Dryococelus australis TaxID=614101 RepID=A0ABQ9H500_9NEOP|nr:hypothetical protein PR048_019973 [Dryococelus australis]
MEMIERIHGFTKRCAIIGGIRSVRTLQLSFKVLCETGPFDSTGDQGMHFDVLFTCKRSGVQWQADRLSFRHYQLSPGRPVSVSSRHPHSLSDLLRVSTAAAPPTCARACRSRKETREYLPYLRLLRAPSASAREQESQQRCARPKNFQTNLFCFTSLQGTYQCLPMAVARWYSSSCSSSDILIRLPVPLEITVFCKHALSVDLRPRHLQPHGYLGFGSSSAQIRQLCLVTWTHEWNLASSLNNTLSIKSSVISFPQVEAYVDRAIEACYHLTSFKPNVTKLHCAIARDRERSYRHSEISYGRDIRIEILPRRNRGVSSRPYDFRSATVPEPLLASHKRKGCSIPGRVTPGLSQVEIVPDDATGKRVFSGISRFPHPFIPTLLHSQFILPLSDLTRFESVLLNILMNERVIGFSQSAPIPRRLMVNMRGCLSAKRSWSRDLHQR